MSTKPARSARPVQPMPEIRHPCTQAEFSMLKTIAHRALHVLLVMSLAACSALPVVDSRPSMAYTDDGTSALGRLAGSAREAGAPSDAASSGIELMIDGAIAWRTRIQTIAMAQRSLDVQTFHIAPDATGLAFLRALKEAAERGVRVRLLVDDIGSPQVDTLLAALSAYPQVEIRLFNPVPASFRSEPGRYMALLVDFRRLNRRMHNKLLVADGAVAIAGGRNIADEYFVSDSGSRFLDIEGFFVGPLVPELGRAFDLYWNSPQVWPLSSVSKPRPDADEQRALFEAATRDIVAPAERLREDMALADNASPLSALLRHEKRLSWARVKVVVEHPSKVTNASIGLAAQDERIDPDSVRATLANITRGTRQEILLVTPYLVPTQSSLDIIARMHRQGVRMATLTNSLATIDEPLAYAAYRRVRPHLIDAGVELFELTPTPSLRPKVLGKMAGDRLGRLHAKLAIIDRSVIYIGSYNFDQRSAYHNTEIGLIIQSEELGQAVGAVFDEFSNDRAYQVSRGPAGNLVWRDMGDTAVDQVNEPIADWWTRFKLMLLSPLVPEDML